jgi:hypothetical protein
VDFCKRFHLHRMKRKIFICCSYQPVKKFLEKRFGREHFFLERHAALLTQEEDIPFIKELVHTFGFEELVLTQDLDCIFFRDIVHQKNELIFPQKDFLIGLYQKNITEIEKEIKISSKIGTLYIAYLEQIHLTFLKEPALAGLIRQHQLEVKGMLTQIQKGKSMEFNLNLAYQAV